MALYKIETINGQGKSLLRFATASDSLAAEQHHNTIFPEDQIVSLHLSLGEDPKRYGILLYEYPCTSCPVGNKPCRHLTSTVTKVNVLEVFARSKEKAAEFLAATTCPHLKYKVISIVEIERRKDRR